MTITKAHAALLSRLAELTPKPLPTYPEAEDVLALNAHLRAVAEAVDAYVLEIGTEANESSRDTLDLWLFTNILSDAITGNATYELECLAQAWADENDQYHDGKYEGVG